MNQKESITFIKDPFFFSKIERDRDFANKEKVKFNECLDVIINERKEKQKEFEDDKCLMHFYLLKTYYLFCFYVIYVYIYLNIL